MTMEPLKGKRYSESFKLKVVKEVSEGKFTAGEAERYYEIKGHSTVNKWLKKYLNSKYTKEGVIKLKMESDEKKIKELEKRVRELEKALSDAYIEGTVNKELIRLAKDKLGIDLKKNSGLNVLNQ
jgi:transposase